MSTPPATDSSAESIESRALSTGKWGNLFMAFAGIAAAYLSHSDALLVDGLYSGVNFISAIVATKVAAAISRPADRLYPFGYDAYEALYVNFRSLILLGITSFAVLSAIIKIITYATGGEVPALVMGPIIIYVITMVAICLTLAVWYHHHWKRTNRSSDILKTEVQAAIVDAVISGGAGLGIVSVSLLRDTSLSFIVPVADSIVVLIMCAFIVRQPADMFRKALLEAAGVSADAEHVQQAHVCSQEVVRELPYSILETSAVKIGRKFNIVVYIKPEYSVSPDEVDTIREQLDLAHKQEFGQSATEVVITKQPPYEPSADNE